MGERKAEKIYRSIMLIVITAIITALLTTIFVYKKIVGMTDIKTIVKSENNTGLELMLAEIRNKLVNKYIGTIDDEKMIEGAIKGYVAGIGDEYTVYYTPDELKNLWDEATRKLCRYWNIYVS